MSASASSILPYRTRSRMIVSYDEDFGKVDWKDFEEPIVDQEPIVDDFAKVDWDKYEDATSEDEEVPLVDSYPTFDLKISDLNGGWAWVAFTTSVGDRLYRIKAKSSRLLYPFVFHGAEIVGYTTDLVTINADFKKEWHPLMEEVVKWSKHIGINPSLRKEVAPVKKWDIPDDGEVHLWVHNGVQYVADAYRCVWSITADEDLEWAGIYNLNTGVIDPTPEPIYYD